LLWLRAAVVERLNRGLLLAAWLRQLAASPPLTNFGLAQIRAMGPLAAPRPHFTEYCKISIGAPAGLDFSHLQQPAQSSGELRPPDSRPVISKLSKAPLTAELLEFSIADFSPSTTADKLVPTLGQDGLPSDRYRYWRRWQGHRRH
jgi:hypothetical protein